MTAFAMPIMKHWTRTALFFLLVATLIGAMLRWAFVGGTASWMNFRNFMHAHSHLAMLGWVFLMLFTLLIYSFLSDAKQQAKGYKILFVLQVISCTGMLITFPIQGYGAFSISFSTFHILISYAFVWLFWKDLNSDKSPGFTVSRLFIKTALVFMVISTLALWAMGPIMAGGMRGTAFYYATVQFYLHFQFNGWFVFAVLGLLFKIGEDKNIVIPAQKVRIFYYLLVTSCVLTYALAVAWGNPLPFIFWINGIGVTIQLIALIYFLIILRQLLPQLKSTTAGMAKLFIGIAIACFVLKVFVQSAVVIPLMAKVAYTVRNFVIGFIHLMLLGVITNFIIGYAHSKGLIVLKSKPAKIGAIMFIIAFFATELILFGQGLLLWGAVGFLPYYYEGLFAFSALFPLSVFLLLLGQSSFFKVNEKTANR